MAPKVKLPVMNLPLLLHEVVVLGNWFKGVYLNLCLFGLAGVA